MNFDNHSKQTMTTLEAVRAIRHVLKNEPNLTKAGFKDDLSSELFIKERKSMLDEESVDEFLRAVSFLACVNKTKAIGKRQNSYSLKHEAEKNRSREFGNPYVSNGMMIAAAIHLGFEYCRVPYAPINAYFNIGALRQPLPEPITERVINQE
jgi:hypothetical protein